jgi:hypothetical protein
VTASFKTKSNYCKLFIARKKTSVEKGFKILITRKVSFDDTDRYYFGLITGFSYVQNKIIFTNAFSSIELRTLFRIGPYFSYDAFRTGNYRFSIGTGLTYNLHKSSIFMEDTEFYLSEEKRFSGFSISPLASLNFEITKIIPGVDLVMGSDVYFYLPHSQTGLKDSTFPELWTDNQIKSSTKAQVSLFIGIQTRF